MRHPRFFCNRVLPDRILLSVTLVRLLTIFVCAGCWLLPAQTPVPLDLVRKSIQASIEDDPKSREYTLIQESTEREMMADGKVKSTKRKTYEVSPLGGEPYYKLIRKDGRPLSPEEARKEQQKYDDTARKRGAETSAERGRRLADFDDRIRRRREMLEELPKAMNFNVAGEEVLDGNGAWVIEMKPKPGYEPRSMRTAFLTKMEGRVWVSQADYRMMKVDVVTTGPVSFGWVLAKLAPGTRITLEQIRLPEGVWMMKRFKINYDVKIAFIKQMRGETEHLMWDHHRPAVSASTNPASSPARRY